MIEIPRFVDDIIEKLYKGGFEAYIVGGCVRDALMGKTPSDYDIATNAKPEEVKKIFIKTVDTGIKHGTVTVVTENNNIEVTTFRTESEYEKSRRPRSVEFINDLKTDLSRRDFTINAMAYNKYVGLVDYFDGQGDIKEKMVKAVGDPDLRFNEDALRMLRAVRFCAALGFSLEYETELAIKKNAQNISNISGERIRIELDKILVSDRPGYFSKLYETKVLDYIIPELSLCFRTEQNTKYHLHNVGEHTLKAVEFAPRDLVLRWAMLLHDIGKPEVKTTDEFGVDHFFTHAAAGGRIAGFVMDRLKFGNDLKHKVFTLVAEHDTDILPDKKGIKRFMNKIGEDLFLKLLTVKKCDLMAKNKEKCAARIHELGLTQEMTDEILKNGEPIYLKDLAIGGADVAKLGLCGKEIGDMLNHLLEHVFEFPGDNKRDILLSLIKDRTII